MSIFSLVQVLISSDGMARGIDIVGIDCVINYDAPSHFRSYLHRVGRTARAGNEGIAYTFLTPDEVLYALCPVHYWI